MRTLLTIIILQLLLLSSHSYAQQNDVYTSYGVDDGLPQSSVWNMVQDKSGFLWLGTADGVCRFDGYNFTVYRNNPADSNTIIGGIYFRVYSDSSGNIWVISQNGISVYNDIKDNFRQVLINKDLHISSNYNYIFGEDKQYLWVGIRSYGLVKIDKRTHTVTLVNNDVYKVDIAQSASQTGLVANGRIWMPSNKTHSFVYDIKASGFDTVCDRPNLRIVNFNDSEVLAATTDGLIVYNKSKLTHRFIPVELSKGQPVNITDILVVSPLQVILSSAIGLSYIDTRTWQIEKQTVSFTQGKKRSYSYIQCLYRDRSGNLWIGTNGDGLKKLTRPYKNFKWYNHDDDEGSLVKGLFADNKNIYAGYFANGFDIFDRKKGWTKKVVLGKSGQAINSVYAISAIDSEHLVVYCHGELSLYSISSGRNVEFAPTLKKLLPGIVHVPNGYPFLLNTGKTIYTNHNDYLISFDVSAHSGVIPAIVHQFKGEVLSCAFEDSRKVLWIGTNIGVYGIENGVAEKVVLPQAELIKTVAEDKANNIWVGTIKGIYVLGPDKKIIAHYDENNGLSNRFIYGILRDDDGNMWFSHNKGLSEYIAATRSFRHFDRNDGLQSNEFNTGAYFKSADGELFFGGINGVNSFYPREIKDNMNVPVVKITSIKLFDVPMKTDSAYWNIHALRLPYTDNSLSFEFAALEYTNPIKNRYAYMMEGVDRGWIMEGYKRFARYAALPPGHYVFKVKAANNDGVWQEQPVCISIDIIPPFWQRPWVILLAFLLFIACLSGIIIWIQKQRHKREIRALELKQKIQLERERISRDLHDTVGTQLSLISNNIEWVAHPLKEITENEKNEKLNFVNTTARDIIATLRETIWALNKQQIPIEEFSDKLKAFVQKQLSIYPEITLDFNEQISVNVILGPSEALDLFRICQEAIANALKYAHATILYIQVFSSDERYKVSIGDNGNGFDISKVDAAIQNGIENMRFRAGDIGANFTIIAEPGKGTSIEVIKNIR